MSAGKFDLNGKYESDAGNVYRCRPQPETKELSLDGTANSYPADAITAGLGSVTLTKSKRSLGVIPRTVTVRLTADGASETADYEGEGTSHVVVVFNPTTYAGYAIGDTGTYLGIACVLDFKQPEVLR
jgi:hypothetical protein